MSYTLLTQNGTIIIGQVAWVLGKIMDLIFNALDSIGIPNIGLSIILFTIIINILLLPLTIKQQKFSKLNAKISPEIQAINAKYKNRKDSDSMAAMQSETKEIYAKYGVSPTGSCLQLLIQMPILFALYRVIYSMPSYVAKIKEAFFPLVENIISNNDAISLIESFKASAMFKKQFANELFIARDAVFTQNTIIDVLNKATSSDWQLLSDKFSSLSSQVMDTVSQLDVYNNFLGLNIANSPSYTIMDAYSQGKWGMIIGAILIPFLAAATQWFNVKLTPQASNGNDENNSMAQSMKTMNMMMPIMSAVFCFTLPAGMGIYWIAGAVVRSIQQVLINKHIDKIDMDDMLAKNAEKNKHKVAKLKEKNAKIAKVSEIGAGASIRTRSISSVANMINDKNYSNNDSEQSDKSSNNSGTKSIADRARMVKDYNERK